MSCMTILLKRIISETTIVIFDNMNEKYLPGEKLNAELQNNFFGYFLYRVPSFFISFLFIKLNLPASFATFISLLSAFCLPIISFFRLS